MTDMFYLLVWRAFLDIYGVEICFSEISVRHLVIDHHHLMEYGPYGFRYLDFLWPELQLKELEHDPVTLQVASFESSKLEAVSLTALAGGSVLSPRRNTAIFTFKITAQRLLLVIRGN